MLCKSQAFWMGCISKIIKDRMFSDALNEGVD